MHQVLIHIDQNLGPIGAWGYHDDTLTHFYPDSLDTAISSRARLLMAHRHDDISVPEWMRFVADTDPTLLDEYQTFNIEQDLPLNQILAQFRHSWVATDS